MKNAARVGGRSQHADEGRGAKEKRKNQKMKELKLMSNEARQYNIHTFLTYYRNSRTRWKIHTQSSLKLTTVENDMDHIIWSVYMLMLVLKLNNDLIDLEFF